MTTQTLDDLGFLGGNFLVFKPWAEDSQICFVAFGDYLGPSVGLS